jgi:hypothetical protein
MVKQDGLKWVAGTFGLEPRWTAEPLIANIELLARKHLKLEQNAGCQVTFYAQGAFNKLYKIETEAGCFLMRVTLPVDPFNKTNSEVATITFVQLHTEIPVPQIIAFDDSSENELGFEYILMEMLPGETLRTRWRKLSGDAKRKLVKQVANYQAQLFCRRFNYIANFFARPGALPISKQSSHSTIAVDTKHAPKERQRDVFDVFYLGQVVSMIFFWGDHITQDVPRGPFEKSEDWIRARLKLVLTDQERIKKTSDDEDDLEEAEDAIKVVKRLLKLLPSVFPSSTDTSELFVLFHDDLSMENILVDGDGEITGIIDWECVSTLPLWRASAPVFLKGRDRNQEPKRDEYAPDNGEEDAGGLTKEALDNEGVNSLYWEHLLEYELTMLRGLFSEEMKKVADIPRFVEMEAAIPEWTDIVRGSAIQADFEEAVQNCDNGWRTKTVNSWLDAMERGQYWSLRKSFLE